MKPISQWGIKEWTVAIVCAFLVMGNPYGRAIVLFILPLDNGVDDFIFMGLAVIGLVMLLVNYIKQRRSPGND